MRSVIYIFFLFFSLFISGQVTRDSSFVYENILLESSFDTVGFKNRFRELYSTAVKAEKAQWRYDVLVFFADQYINVAPDWCLDKLIKAESISLSVDQVSASKKLYYDLGQLYLKEEEAYHLAFTNYQKAKRIIEQQGPPSEVDLLMNLIVSSYYAGFKDSTKKYAHLAWVYDENNEELKVFAGKWQLKLSLEQSFYQDVIYYADQILPYSKSDKQIIDLYLHQLRAYNKLNQIDNAEKVYYKAIRLISKSQDTVSTFSLYMEMATCYQNQSMFAEMVKEYQNAQDVASTNYEHAKLYVFWARSLYVLRDNKEGFFEHLVSDARRYNKKAQTYIKRLSPQVDQKELELLYIYYDTEYKIVLLEENVERAAILKQKMTDTQLVISRLKEEKRVEEVIEESKLKDKIIDENSLEFKNQSLIQQNNLLKANSLASKKITEAAIAKENEAKAEADRSEALRKEAIAINKQLYAESQQTQAILQAELANKHAVRDSIAKVKAERDQLIAEDKERDAIEKEKQALRTAKQRKERIENQRYAVLVMFFLMLLASYFLWRIRKQRNTIIANKKLIELEKNRSDELLLSILPMQVAEELKATNKATPQHYDEVSVLFADFKGFTTLSEKLHPTDLLAILNSFFEIFDEVVDHCGLERIKTIGDSYMAAGGIPVSNTSHPVDTVNAALLMQEKLCAKRKELGIPEDEWQMRIGVHSGPVVAGVVGKLKFAYDIWGDAVNIASRLETNSEAGRVNVSQATFERIKDSFSCEYRGEIDVKNRGKIGMYFVSNLKV